MKEFLTIDLINNIYLSTNGLRKELIIPKIINLCYLGYYFNKFV